VKQLHIAINTPGFQAFAQYNAGTLAGHNYADAF